VRYLAKMKSHWNVNDVVKKCVLLPMYEDSDREEPLESGYNLAITILHSDFSGDLEEDR